jgi:HlyD family secretion protein
LWKWLGLVLLLILGLCAAAAIFASQSGVQALLRSKIDPDSSPATVRFGTAEVGSLQRAVSAPGELEPKSKVEISAQISARILELPKRENAVVAKNDVLVKLDDRDLVALLDSAKAQLAGELARLDGARAEVATAEADLSRTIRLVETGDIPKTDRERSQLTYDRALSSLRQIEQSIESARASIRRAEKDLDNTVIRSPIDGIVTILNAEIGETVVVGTLNSPGSVIMEVADLATMMVKARVDEGNIAPVKQNQRARVYINAYRDREFSGYVEYVSLKRQNDRENTPYFEVRVAIDRPAKSVGDAAELREGLAANVDLLVENFDNIIRVPSQAVVDRAIDDLPSSVTKDNPLIDTSKKFTRVVFGEVSGKAVAIPVKTGVSDQTHTVIIDGLKAGQRVVVGPYKELLKLKHDRALEDEATKPKDKKEGDKAGEGALPNPETNRRR